MLTVIPRKNPRNTADPDELHISEGTYQTSSQFAARLRLSTMLPTLVLEEIENHIESITCIDSGIRLRFADIQSMHLAYQELCGIQSFFVITSHEGCNRGGERTAYR